MQLVSGRRMLDESDCWSRRESNDAPFITRTAVAKSIVQAVRSSLPELDLGGHDPVATPVRGSRDIGHEPLVQVDQRDGEDISIGDLGALIGCPGSKL